MAIQNAVQSQNLFQNLSVTLFRDINPKNGCTFDLFVVHRQNLKIVLSQLLRQSALATEHLDTNGHPKRFSCRSAL